MTFSQPMLLDTLFYSIYIIIYISFLFFFFFGETVDAGLEPVAILLPQGWLEFQACTVRPGYHRSASKSGNLFLKLIKILESENSELPAVYAAPGGKAGFRERWAGLRSLGPSHALRTLGAKLPSFSRGAKARVSREVLLARLPAAAVWVR